LDMLRLGNPKPDRQRNPPRCERQNPLDKAYG
jgi:hypothetical protein